jgi:hypothetical protein
MSEEEKEIAKTKGRNSLIKWQIYHSDHPLVAPTNDALKDCNATYKNNKKMRDSCREGVLDQSKKSSRN